MAANGHPVLLWAREPEVLQDLRDNGRNSRFAPALSVLTAAAGEPVRVYACEARPLLQGARLTGVVKRFAADAPAAPEASGGRGAAPPA